MINNNYFFVLLTKTSNFEKNSFKLLNIINMKRKHLVILLTVVGITSLFSCKNKDLFEQPTIDITGFSLQELPGEYTHLNVDMLITNNDSREATIADVAYQVVVEGITSEAMTSDINKEILVGTPLKLTLPLTLKTKDAIQLLAKLDKGQKLDYSVTGTFHADEPVLKRFDLPIDVQGTADVDAGYEDFYKQPDVTVTDLTVSSSGDDTSGYTYNFDVTCDVKNNDTRNVSIDEVEYVVTINGLTSETQLYSDTYTENISVNGGATISLTLPVTFDLTAAQKVDLDNAIASGTVNYSVEGTFHAIEVDGSTTDFVLPLYVTGSISVEDMFKQPDITVNDIDGTYTEHNINSYTFNLNCNSTITNLDSRSAVIDEIVYVVTTEGVDSEEEHYTTSITINGNSSIDRTLPADYNVNGTQAAQMLNGFSDGNADYVINGTFHVIEVDGEAADLTLPLHNTGSVPVSVIEQ